MSLFFLFIMLLFKKGGGFRPRLSLKYSGRKPQKESAP